MKHKDNPNNPEEILFFPEHPSDEKTDMIEAGPLPVLEQDAPFDAAALHQELCDDLETALKTYEDKRFIIKGVVKRVGPDIHDKPSLEITDADGEICHALCIFPNEDIYDQAKAGDIVTVRANYLVLCNMFGVVMKYSELL